MRKRDRKTFGFNLTALEQSEVTGRTGGLSIGEYARRLVLDAPSDAHCDTRETMGRVLLAIHSWLHSGGDIAKKEQVLDLLERAMLELSQRTRKRSSDAGIGFME